MDQVNLFLTVKFAGLCERDQTFKCAWVNMES